MSATTTNKAALLNAAATPLVIDTLPIPKPGAGEVLIRNHAIAVNPVDWKRQAWGFAIPSYPAVLGSDVTGVVESVGPDVTAFKAGDRVIGYASGFATGENGHGAFQSYTITPVITTAKLPDNISFEKGALIPMGGGTASVGLFKNLGLARPTSAPANKQDSILLVWGGSGSVGTMVIQLANLIGFTVFATASPAQHKYLKTLGASQLFDYHSPTIVDDIVSAAKAVGKPISYAFDAVSEPGTLQPAAEVLIKSGGKDPKLSHVLPWPETVPEVKGLSASSISGESLWTSEKALGNWLFNNFITSALEKGTIVPSPEVQVVQGGLEALQGAMDQVRAGVHAKKLVIKLS
ncbi:Dehydrogenase azaJ [Hyphodiscus hymeniophilus]|uniref:Dehydrogenase azaJ n=1 Tax=Hyphodiscus hymeniophilus TaxID=353542 RepID=A0A9P7AY68_9HELO|nr:Dehydrogenase azaJ [Hyphodiscus hymeniophilus]